ncbi:MAG: 3-isopropylmalate dehydrogenase [Planctomycetes bacterium]|nr:3-isopropylmalate dehydrogenase [Planctomycetota bacterium]NUQ33698.1 3-isopropylmalate dehydrogenase [Planctomycetaceae bacterium]
MTDTLNIAVLGGDGIGPEVTAEALRALKTAGERFNFKVESESALVGASAVRAGKQPLPDETLKLCLASDAILFGAVGDPAFGDLPPDQLPERALLHLRKGLDLFANLRPVRPVPALLGASSIKAEMLTGVDILIVRELVSGLYFGTPRGYGADEKGRFGFNTMRYHETEIVRVAKVAFDAARKRKKKLCSADKANALEVMQLWRETVTKLGKDSYPDIALNHMYVDNCAMQLVQYPRQFDVLLAENMFGDILSDIGAQITGSLGMLPSASIGGRVGLYEPVHGSAPDIAGKGIANPLAAILSAGMLLTYSAGKLDAAKAIEDAVDAVLADGYRTKDIASQGGANVKVVSTKEMGDAVVAKIRGK